jgi:hypothetical protein
VVTFGIVTSGFPTGRSVSKTPPPLLGFNNNVRHRGRIFHIQTEDSGVKFPRIVTHLFADGGRIIKTTRTEYAEHVAKPDLAAVVRGMMKEQHKAMFAALRTGQLDVLLEQACGPLEAPSSKAPSSVQDPTSRRDMDTARVVVGSARPVATPEPTRRPAPAAVPAAAPLELDVASLEEDEPQTLRLAPTPSARPPRKSNPAPRKSRPPLPARPSAAAVPLAAAAGAELSASLSRPQTRLAAPPTNPRSLFGDGAISEQSLDEVILSYLAEDLDDTK